MITAGVSHHFSGGRIGDELGGDAPARRQPMAKLDGETCGLPRLPEMGQDRVAQVNGKTQPG